MRAAFALCLIILSGCASGDGEEPLFDIPYSGELVDVDGFPLEGGVWPVDLDELLDAADREWTRYRRGSVRDVADLADATAAMESRLREMGHQFALVEFRCIPSEDQVESVVFAVHPGPRKVIAGPAIVRLESPSGEKRPPLYEDELQKIAAWLAPPESLFGGVDDSFQEVQVERGIGAIQTYYRLLGHPHVELAWREIGLDGEELDARFTPGSGDLPLRIEVTIVRGPRVVVRDLTRSEEGAESTREAIDQAMAHAREVHGLGSGRVAVDLPAWHPRRVSEIEGAIRDHLRDRGHQLAKVEARTTDIGSPQFQDEQERVREVTLNIDISAGPILILDEPVAIEGLQRTDEDFLRDRIAMAVGEAATGPRVKDSLLGVYDTGLFSLATLKPVLPESSEMAAEGEEQRVPYLLELEEVEARTFDVEVGYGSYELLRTRVRYRDRNFFGIGRELDSSVWASLRSYGTSVRFIDPWTLGDRWTLEAGSSLDFRQRPSFDSTRFEFELATKYRIHDRGYSPQLWLNFGYRFTADKAEDTTNDVLNADSNSFVITAGIFAQFTRDSRSDVLLPSDGSLQQVGLFLSRPELGAELSFVEFSIFDAHQWALTESEGTVLAVGSRLVTRQILNDDESLPIQERLFLGGESTVRSFCEDGLGPADSAGEALGGLTTFFTSVELRQRLSGDLWGAAFWDAGTVGSESFDFDDGWGHAVGLGLRYYLPFGPVRLDFGYNPAQRFASDDPWALHVAFGFSF